MKEKQSICWRCQNAVPDKTHGCRWSKAFRPVPGWRVKRTQVSAGEDENGRCRMIKSYLVLSCPQFLPDKPRVPATASRMRRLYAQRAASGLCARCGGLRTDLRFLICASCREKMRDNRRKKTGKRKES